MGLMLLVPPYSAVVPCALLLIHVGGIIIGTRYGRRDGGVPIQRTLQGIVGVGSGLFVYMDFPFVPYNDLPFTMAILPHACVLCELLELNQIHPPDILGACYWHQFLATLIEIE